MPIERQNAVALVLGVVAGKTIHAGQEEAERQAQRIALEAIAKEGGFIVGPPAEEMGMGSSRSSTS